MDIFDVDERYLKDNGFLFLTIEIVDYLKKQIKNGVYIDNGLVGHFYKEDGSPMCIDGLDFRNGYIAYLNFREDEEYNIKEETRYWNCDKENTRTIVYVYRNKKLFEVDKLYDISNRARRIAGVGDVCFDENIVTDIRILNKMLSRWKYTRVSYGDEMRRAINELRAENKRLETENIKRKEKNCELIKTNKTIKDENREIKRRIANIESKGTVLDKNTKKILECLISTTERLKEVAEL